MSSNAELTKVSVREFARRFRPEMVPLSNSICYFTALPLGEEDIKDYLSEPLAAVPPKLQALLGRISILLVPYLEKPNGKAAEMVTFVKPAQKNQTWATQFTSEGQATVVLAVKDEDVADYHYVFYRALAALTVDALSDDVEARYSALLREELRANAHGEVDEASWHAKQELLTRQSQAARDSKLFRTYMRESFIDTLTLYLHGICCDIDVETGPRQVQSRYLRKRLLLLQEVFPPPPDFAVFPDEIKGRK